MGLAQRQEAAVEHTQREQKQWNHDQRRLIVEPGNPWIEVSVAETGDRHDQRQNRDHQKDVADVDPFATGNEQEQVECGQHGQPAVKHAAPGEGVLMAGVIGFFLPER